MKYEEEMRWHSKAQAANTTMLENLGSFTKMKNVGAKALRN
jgi:hypothetical protein